MRLLFDENLSHRLVRQLEDVYPGSEHIRNIGLRGAEDRLIWEHAADSDFVLTSKDTDFYQRSLMFGAPPKVLWLRIGNSSTKEISELLRRHFPLVRRFAEDAESSFLILKPANESPEEAPRA